MFSSKTYKERREELRSRLSEGLVLLLGSGYSPYNYLNNAYPFRQDSTFLYYFGLQNSDLAGVLDIDSGEDTLFGDDQTVDDIIWSGVLPSQRELGERVGVESTRPIASLAECISQAIKQGRKVHFLPPYRAETKLQLSDLLGLDVSELHDAKSVDLMFAVSAMRERKSVEEIAEIERAISIGYKMHTAAMRMCREGVVEREIAGLIEGIALAEGAGVSFRPIVTQNGQTLHNHNVDGVLQSGRLLLCDAGAETVNNYCSDHTRTYPISGRFTDVQRDIYNIVLSAHANTERIVKPDMLYMDAHTAALTIMAEGLRGVGLLSGSAEDAVAAGAMALFMPHGLGHGMGMDVHDCEALGERSFDFSSLVHRAATVGSCVHRATWRLREGTVLSNEPGIYFIPALIEKYRNEGKFKGIVNYEALEAFHNFGGIRLEDDILVTNDGCRTLGTEHIPITVEELEAVIGVG